ncbi:MAG: hypothetical protein LWY06_05905 [Firmicutes bacterium]|nr:hypothetical protein [Bacillota bacterium]
MLGVFLNYERFYLTARILAFTLIISTAVYFLYNNLTVHYGVMFFAGILIFNIIVLTVLNIAYLFDDFYKWRKTTVIVLLSICFLTGMTMLVSADMHLTISNHFFACIRNEENIAEALKKYKDDNKIYPESLQALCPLYLRTVPACFTRGGNEPVSEKAAQHYRHFYHVNVKDYLYEVSEDRQVFTISCNGQNHYVVGVGEGYPKETSLTGSIPR